MKKPQRRVTTERVNSAFAKYDQQAIEKFAAGASAMLDAYHERTVAPLAERVAQLERPWWRRRIGR